jgi:hypothetical protein
MMLIAFLYKQAVIHKELLLEEKPAKSEFYVQILERLLKRGSRVKKSLHISLQLFIPFYFHEYLQ